MMMLPFIRQSIRMPVLRPRPVMVWLLETVGVPTLATYTASSRMVAMVIVAERMR